MIKFKEIENESLILEHSPFVRVCKLTLDCMTGNKGIGLTKNKAFNRKFIHWAAAELNWLHHSHGYRKIEEPMGN